MDRINSLQFDQELRNDLKRKEVTGPDRCIVSDETLTLSPLAYLESKLDVKGDKKMNKQMKWKISVLTLAILLVASVPVFAKDSVDITVSHPLSLKGTQVAPGDYKVSWVTHSPDATVTFKQQGKVAATASARMEDRGSKYSETQVVYQTNTDGTRTLLEIRLGGTKQALVFEQ
jgi:hypothetical protein